MIELKTSKTLVLKPEAIAYILDMLAQTPAPWVRTNPLITDIMAQLKEQEEDSGPKSS